MNYLAPSVFVEVKTVSRGRLRLRKSSDCTEFRMDVSLCETIAVVRGRTPRDDK